MKIGKIIKKIKIKDKEIIFRYPKVEDVDDLLKLINSLVKERAYIVIQKNQTKKGELEWFLKNLNEVFNKKRIMIVVELNNQAMGLGEIRVNSKNPYKGELGISLKKEIRNLGVGKELIAHLLKMAQKELKLKLVILYVMAPNKIALHTYKKCGFEIVGEIKKGVLYYGKLLNQVIMVKYL